MATTIAEFQGILTLDDSQYKKGLTDAKGGMSALGGNIRSAGASMTRFGVGASLALAPVTLFLKSSIGAFREFDVAMPNSQTILGATSEEMEILSAQVLDIGANTGLGPQAVADSFFTVVSGVADATTHMDILQSSVTLAEAGLADLAVTTGGMVAVMNSYKFAAEDASFVSDVFTRTVQTGVGTMDEFVSALAPLASLANTMGISFDDLAASEAFLTTEGQSASAAATELQAIMTAFIKPSQGMTDALNLLGFESGKAAIEALGFQGAVDALSASLGDDEVALGEVFTRAEALKGALILAGDGAEQFGETFQEGMDGASQAAADLQNATDSAIGDAFTAKLDALKITIGEDLSGAIADVQTALMPFIESITLWAEENPETVKQILLFAGGLVVAAGALIVVGGLVTALGAAVSILLSPVLLVGGALFLFAGAIGLVDAQPLIDELDKLLEKMTGIREGVTLTKNAIAGLVPNVTGFVTSISQPVSRRDPRNETSGLIPALRADGGPFDAFQPITVGERGPETVVFPQAGNVIANGQSGGGMFDGATFIVQASGEAEGRAAGRGLKMELESIMTRNG